MMHHSGTQHKKEMLQQAIADDAEWAEAADLFAALLTSAK